MDSSHGGPDGQSKFSIILILSAEKRGVELTAILYLHYSTYTIATTTHSLLLLLLFDSYRPSIATIVGWLYEIFPACTESPLSRELHRRRGLASTSLALSLLCRLHYFGYQ